MPKVIVIFREQERIFELKSGSNIVGRSGKCGIHIKDDGISRQHCDIVNADGKCIVYDKGSKNGTVVNGEKITQKELLPGDKIKIGSTRIFFELKKEAVESEEAVIGDKDDFEFWVNPQMFSKSMIVVILILIAVPLLLFLKRYLTRESSPTQSNNKELHFAEREDIKSPQSGSDIQVSDSNKNSFDILFKRADNCLDVGNLGVAYNMFKGAIEYANSDEQIANVNSNVEGIKKMAQSEWDNINPKIILANMTRNLVICEEAKSLIKEYIERWGDTDLIDDRIQTSLKEITTIEDEVNIRKETSRAEALLKNAKDFYSSGKLALAASICNIITNHYIGTQAAGEAETLLEEIQGNK